MRDQRSAGLIIIQEGKVRFEQYGLDFDELYRNIPFIAVLKPEAFGGVDPE